MDRRSAHDLAALAQVVLIDIALAGDNAVVVGMAVAGLPASSSAARILLGIGGATVHSRRARRRHVAIARDHRTAAGRRPAAAVGLLEDVSRIAPQPRAASGTRGDRQKTLGQAMLQIMLADLSMSLDNVLAVAGAASGQHLGAGGWACCSR